MDHPVYMLTNSDIPIKMHCETSPSLVCYVRDGLGSIYSSPTRSKHKLSNPKRHQHWPNPSYQPNVRSVYVLLSSI